MNPGFYGWPQRRTVRARSRSTDYLQRGRQPGDNFDRFQLTGDGSRVTGDGSVTPTPDVGAARLADPDFATYGFPVFPIHESVTSSTAFSTQNLCLSRIKAPVTITTTQVRMALNAYSATGHTYSGYGIFSDDPDGGATLLSKYEDTGSPPTTFLDSTTLRTVTMTSPVNWVRGRFYWVGPVMVFTGGAAATNTKGVDNGGLRPEANLGAGGRQGILVTTATIPSSVSAATIASATGRGFHYYARFLP